MKKLSNLTKIKLAQSKCYGCNIRIANNNSHNKRYLSANGSSLLPLALRPRLFLMLLLFIVFGITLANNNDTFAASITLTIPKDSISLTVNPNKDGGFAKSSPQTISVITDDPVGYTLHIMTKNLDGNNSLLGTSSELKSINKTTSEEDYKSDSSLNNTWGFMPNKLYDSNSNITNDNTNFIPGPTREPIILDKTTNANQVSNEYNLSIGAKVDNNLTSGTYSNTFVITAVTNTPPPAMQDFAKMTLAEYNETLGAMEPNKQYEYMDERDEKVYYVSKLADGNVWMTENLDFDLNSEKQLTPEDTDIPSSWTPDSSTDIIGGVNWDTSTDGYNKVMSYDPSDKCWNGVIHADIDNPNEIISRTVNCSQHDNSHYHLGNYYSWSAAVATTNTDDYITKYQDLNQSICPAGWSLSNFDGDKSFKVLMDKAGFTSGVDGNMHKDPYYLNYSGYWYGNIYYIGNYGYDWSSVISSDVYGYGLYFRGAGSLHAQYEGYRNIGFSVRCVARTPKIKYTINYNLNSGSGVSTPQVGSTSESSVKLDSTTPTRSGYEFKGWCDQETSDDTCSGTTYPAGADFPLSPSTDNDVTLHAMWKQQIADGASCSAPNYSGSAKYYGGLCWMWSDYRTNVNWSTANSACPSGWHLPSQSEFQTLLNNVGTGGQLYGLGWSGYYWSSTPNGSLVAYNLSVYSTYVGIYDNNRSGSGNVRCATADYSALKSYTITYDVNMEDTSNVPSTQTGQTAESQINLDSKTPEQTTCGHTFKGWCTIKPTNVHYPSSPSCSGTLYQPGAPIPLPDNDNNITLYGMWQLIPAGTPCNSNAA